MYECLLRLNYNIGLCSQGCICKTDGSLTAYKGTMEGAKGSEMFRESMEDTGSSLKARFQQRQSLDVHDKDAHWSA